MSMDTKSPDLGRISLYDIETSHMNLTPADMQLKRHTGYDDEHLKRLKYLFQQVTGPQRETLDVDQFESAARSLCRSLTESREAHHLAEILFKAYDKNINGSIDFAEMIDFVWTVVDAPREEQIAGLYQALRGSNGKLSKDRLIEFLTILKEDFQPKVSAIEKKPPGQLKSMKTDEEIQARAEECLSHYHNPSNGLSLTQVIEYFLGAKDPLVPNIKTRWNARTQRREQKNRK